MSAWVRKQTDQRLKTLQENKHYSVLVTNVATEPCSLSVFVRCVGCNTCIHLQKKDSSSEATPYLISNWSRHVKKCVSCKHTGFKYPRIDHFLAGCPSDSVSHDLSESDGVHTDNNLSQTSGLPTVAKAVASSVLPQLDSLQSPITNALSDQLQSSLSAFDGLSETCNSHEINSSLISTNSCHDSRSSPDDLPSSPRTSTPVPSTSSTHPHSAFEDPQVFPKAPPSV